MLSLPGMSLSPVGGLAMELEDVSMNDSESPRRCLFPSSAAMETSPILQQNQRKFSRVATCLPRLERPSSPSVSDNPLSVVQSFGAVFGPAAGGCHSFVSNASSLRPPLIPPGQQRSKTASRTGVGHWNQRSRLSESTRSAPLPMEPRKRDLEASPMPFADGRQLASFPGFDMRCAKPAAAPPIKIRKTAEPLDDLDEEKDASISRQDLPHFTTERDALKRITSSTLTELMDGRHPYFDDFVIVDCRFPYEYVGGHIAGAKNVHTTAGLCSMFFPPQHSGRVAVIFHCEFSVQRAPRMALHLRNHDRNVNMELYPKLDYPDVYILHGGYKEFFTLNMPLCEPPNHVAMDDENHREELKKYAALHKAEFKRCYSTGFLRT